MQRMKTYGGAVLLAALTVPLRTAAQPSAPDVLKRTPVVYVFGMPGFNARAFPNAAGAEIALAAGEEPFTAVTLQSDVGGACYNRLQAPALPSGRFDETASAEWRFEAAPVSDDGEEATFDVKLERRVPRPGRLLESTYSETRRLTMRDGSRGILDFVRAVPGAPGVCETFAIVVELGFRSMKADVEQAGLGFDLWLVDRMSSSASLGRTRVEATQGQELTYGFAPVALNGASGEVRVFVSGAVKGRARRDGLIDLVIDTTHTVSTTGGNTSGGGRKRIAVRPGETIEFELPEPLKAKLPLDLRQHDFALRVTAERRW
jgi:hypothetical protein